MDSAYTKQEKIAGLFFLGGLIFIFLSAIIVGGGRDWFRSYQNYYAIYNNGYGLAPGTKIKFLRTDVGLVTRLELTENDKVKVSLSILSEYANRIKTDSVAQVASPTFIGSEYLDIVPGSVKTAVIPKGGQIPATERREIMDYIVDLHLDTMLARAETLLINLDNFTRQLQDPSGDFMMVVKDVHRITNTVAEGQGTIGHLVISDETISIVQDTLKKIQAASGTIAGVTDELSPIVQRAGVIATQVEKTTRQAPEAMREAQRGLRNANEVLESAKRNFLIRGNLPPKPDPGTQTYPIRQ